MSTTSSVINRSLAILQSISLTDRPLRYSELKAVTPGIPDSSFSRLLRTLERFGYLTRELETGYTSGPGVRRWIDAIRQTPRDFSDVAAETIQALTSTTQESAAIAVLEGEAIRIIESKSMPDAISVIGKDGTLFFEEDHAASLVILHQLSPGRRAGLLQSRYSRIRSKAAYAAGVKSMLRSEGVWLDRSKARLGICRMALPFDRNGKPGAVFLCLTVTAARRQQDALLRELRASQATLQNAARHS